MPNCTSSKGILPRLSGRLRTTAVAFTTIFAIALSGCASKLPMAPSQLEANNDRLRHDSALQAYHQVLLPDTWIADQLRDWRQRRERRGNSR